MKKILVVDDEESIRLLYREELTQAGYQVEVAANGLEAFEKIERNPPDLITLDLKMEGLDGISFLRQLREKRRTLPVIICTAYGEFKQDFAVWSSHAYITKSSDLRELLNTVRGIVGA